MSKITLNEFWPYKIAVLADLVSRHTMNIVKSHGSLNLSQWRVLAALGDKDGRSAAEVVSMTPMDKGIVSRAVTTLVEQGFLKRIADTHDKRRRELFLTKSGKVHYDIISKDLQTLLNTPSPDALNTTSLIINLDTHIRLLNQHTEL